jgi:hypothetical protein
VSSQPAGNILRDFLAELAGERKRSHQQGFFRLEVPEDRELLAQILEPFLIDDRPGGLAEPYPERVFAEKVARVALVAAERTGMDLVGRYSREPVYPEAFVEAVATAWERGRPVGAAIATEPTEIEWQAIWDALAFTAEQSAIVSDAHDRVVDKVEAKLAGRWARFPDIRPDGPAAEDLTHQSNEFYKEKLPLLGSNQDSPDPESHGKAGLDG